MITPYLFLLSSLIYFIVEIKAIKKYKTIRLFSLFRFMYAFIFGILPAIILFRIESGTSYISRYFSVDYITSKIFWIWLITVLEYIIISISYKNVLGVKREKTTYPVSSRLYNAKTVRIAIIISLIIGFVSLYQWTRAYGSIFNMIVQANLVRSNASDVVNPWAFLEHFARIFTFTYFVAFALYLYEKKNKGKVFSSLILMIISLTGALVVMLCTDTRGEIGVIAIVTVLYYFVFYKWKDGHNIVKKLLQTGFFFIIAFLLIEKSAGIMDSIRGLETEESSTELVGTIESEFGFTFTSLFTSLEDAQKYPVRSLFVDDITNALFAWVPSRFIPFELPQSLWNYNTELQRKKVNSYGQAPTDFVSASLYLFGYLGILLLPLIMGIVFKKLDAFFLKRRDSIFYSALNGYMFFFSIWWAAFFSFSSTMLSLFGAVLFWVVLRFVKSFVH